MKGWWDVSFFGFGDEDGDYTPSSFSLFLVDQSWFVEN